MRHPEQTLQRQVAEYLSWALVPPAIWTAHPAGGGGELRGRILKGMGLRPGWPDIEIVANDGRFHGIELKSAKGVVSEAQRLALHGLQAAGARVVICRSLDEIREALKAWGIAMRDTKPSTERIKRGFAEAQLTMGNPAPDAAAPSMPTGVNRTITFTRGDWPESTPLRKRPMRQNKPLF